MNIKKTRRSPDPRNTEKEERYHTTRWRKLRIFILRRDDYLCQECLRESKVNVGNVVDHIKPVKRGGDFWDINNLQTLCVHHHDSKSQSERRL